MEESVDEQSSKESSSDSSDRNFGMIENMKCNEYNIETTSNDKNSSYTLNSIHNEDKDEDNDDSLFDAEMEDFDANEFMKGSPLSENLEIDKIMEQLNDSIENSIFASGNNSEDTSILNEDSFKENDSNLELNLMNNDIVSYINSDDTFSKDSAVKNICDTLLEGIDDHDKNANQNEKGSSSSDKADKIDEVNKEEDIIDLINRELDNTLQFTNVLCQYIYSDVTVQKDFFNLFCSESDKDNVKVVNDAVV